MLFLKKKIFGKEIRRSVLSFSYKHFFHHWQSLRHPPLCVSRYKLLSPSSHLPFGLEIQLYSSPCNLFTKLSLESIPLLPVGGGEFRIEGRTERKPDGTRDVTQLSISTDDRTVNYFPWWEMYFDRIHFFFFFETE